MIITGRAPGEQTCWSEPWTGFSARTGYPGPQGAAGDAPLLKELRRRGHEPSVPGRCGQLTVTPRDIGGLNVKTTLARPRDEGRQEGHRSQPTCRLLRDRPGQDA